MVTATTGWRHEDAIEAAKEVMEDIEQSTEFEIDFSEEVGAFTGEGLAPYDLLLFANSSLRVAEPDDPEDREPNPFRNENPAPLLTQAQEQAILDFVRSGNGVAVAHSGIDAFYGSRGYREMVGGGLFASHPWTQQVQIDVEDPGHPAVAHLGENFRLHDEIYVLDANPRPNSHVLLSLNLPSVGGEPDSPTATPGDYPISWTREYGGGRVFVTTLGHFPDVWRSPAYLQHLLQGMRIAAGREPPGQSTERR